MREKIIKATAKIISQKGRDAVSTRAVCSIVGITAPTLYHYFIDKTDLLNSVVAAAFEKNIKQKSEALLSDPFRCILKIWDNYIDFALTEPEFYSVMATTLAQGSVHPIGYLCHQQTLSYFENVANLKLLKYSAQESAAIYQAAAMGVALLSLVSNEKEFYRALSIKTRSLVIDGLFHPPD